MKKQVARLCLFFMLLQQVLFLLPSPVLALTSDELAARNECGIQEYELAYANIDGSLTNKMCSNSYEIVKSEMDNNTAANHENLVILKREDNLTRVFDAKYAIVNLDKNKNSANTNILTSSTTGNMTAYTYINGNSRYGSGDAAYLGINATNERIKVRIGGITGWVAKIEGGLSNYKIVPLAWVKSTTKYIVTTDSITHNTTSDMSRESSSNSITIGPKPTMLDNGTYYSYDGNYFYKDARSMLDDYKEGTTKRSVNNNNPYYNYYQYLPHHTKTTYSGTDIDNYLNNHYDKVLGYNYTVLYGQGYAFYNVQENLGINAMLMLSVAQNESGNGRSGYATVRNNLFGHNAVDSNPDKATLYPSIRDGIKTHANDYFNYGYAFPSNWRFFGSHLGNKIMGANVKYASDPYWGEKAAANYYQMDLANGLQDYNYYQIAAKSKEGTIYPSSVPKVGTNYRISTKVGNITEPYYNYERLGTTITIVEEVKGDTLNGSDIWYKIISDTNINENNQFVQSSGASTKYDWSTNYVYVHSSYFTKLNNTTIKDTTTVTNYPEKKYTYETFTTNGNPTPQVARINKKSTLYNNPTLETKSSRTWNQGQYVVVFEKAYDETGSLKSYQVSSTYKKGFKEWINPEDISFVLLTYGKVRIYNGTYANVRATPGGALLNNSTSGLANGTHVVILDSKIVNGVTWVKIDYDGQFGWVVAKDADQEIFMSISTLENTPPVIQANNQTIAINTNFDALSGVSATDKEDGNITSRIKVDNNNVNTKITGTYQVTYSVTDNANATTTKTIQVLVKDLESKTGIFLYNAITEASKDEFEISGFLAVAGYNNSQEDNVKHKLILIDATTKQEHQFDLNQWKTNYPYDVSNIGDDKPYNYSGGWFKGNVNLSTLPEGDYTAYVEVENGLYKSRMVYNNLVYGPMPRKATGNNSRGYSFQMNYYTKERTLDISIRNEGLLANGIPPTNDRMYNLFETINLKDGKLSLRGTSHNVGIDYSINKQVNREIILENTKTYQRYKSSVGSITTGDYTVDLKVSDGLDKTRAWFDGSIDISTLPLGTYAIYLKTEVGSFSDYGELKDLSYKEFGPVISMNGKKYTLKRIDNKRFRMELTVE